MPRGYRRGGVDRCHRGAKRDPRPCSRYPRLSRLTHGHTVAPSEGCREPSGRSLPGHKKPRLFLRLVVHPVPHAATQPASVWGLCEEGPGWLHPLN